MTILAAIFSAPPWLIGVLFVCLVSAVVTARWGIRLIRRQSEPEAVEPGTPLPPTPEPTPAEIELARQRHGYIPELAVATGPETHPFITEWHEDLPGPVSMPAPRAGEYHERLAGRDMWDQWWAGLDGLHRECLLVTRACEREAAAWALLVAETRELCGLAA